MGGDVEAGTSLAHYLAARGAGLTIGEFLRLALAMAARLAELHSSGWIHGEICPESFVLSSAEPGHEYRPELSAFRVTLLASSRPSRTDAPPRAATAVDGPLLYVAPERTGRMQTPFDHRADLYSLGATFYEMLVGAPPFPGRDPVRVLHGHVAVVPPAPHAKSPSVPRALSSMVMRLLEKMPEHRYQTASALVHDLREAESLLEDSGEVADFELGRTDPGWRLGAARTLYGREREERVLREALARCDDGARELMLLVGPAGIGKTALASHVLSGHRWFGASKFDTLGTSRPYATIADAVDDLIGRLSAAPVELRTRLATRVRGALASHGRALLPLLPSLEPLTGTLPPLPPIGFTEGDPRTRMALRAVIRALASSDSPMVLFLDDLQWADAASIDLIGSLVDAADIAHLLIVGAYRTDALGDNERLSRLVREMGVTAAHVHRLELPALDPGALTALCADLLYTDESTSAPLAKIVAGKATGNPLFVERFLRQLQREGSISVDVIRGTCTYSLSRVAAADVSDDVVDLIQRAIDSLSPSVQRVLAIAACFRGTFVAGDLSPLVEESAETLDALLLTARAEGMLVPAPEDQVQGYRFVHDRVKQAAYERLDDELRAKTHLAIGRRILAAMADPSTDARVFEAVEHLGRGGTIVRSKEERMRLVQVHRMAAHLAKASSGFGAAYTYFKRAIEFLPEDAPEAQRGLFVEVVQGAVTCGFLAGEVDAADRMASDTLHLLSDPLDRGETLRLQALGLTAADRMDDAIVCLRKAAAILGCLLPPSQADEQVLTEVRELGDRLTRIAPSGMARTQALEDERLLLLMRVLSAANAATWLSGDTTLFAAAQTKMVAITLERGVAPESGGAIVRFGAIYADVLGDPSPAYEVSAHGLALALESGDLRTRCRARFGMAFHMSHFRQSLRLCVDEFRAVAELGADSGEFAYAGFARHRGIEAALTMGLELPAVLREIERGSAFAHRYELRTILTDLSMLRGVVRCLQGKATTHDVLTRASEDLERTRSELFPRLNAWMLEVAYLFRRRDEAFRHARAAEPRLRTMPSTLPVTAYTFYDALSRAAWHEAGQGDPERTVIEGHAKKLELWAKSSPDNFAHKALLVRAELARIDGRTEEALRGYADAAAGAGAQGSLVDEATAHELAGRLHAREGRSTMARAAIQRAMHLFARWGSLGKVDALAAEFLDLSEKPSSYQLAELGRGSITGAHLDLLSVLKAVESVSCELVPERLFGRLVDLGLEIASAQGGVLVLREGKDYKLRARGTATEQGVLLRTSLDESVDVPRQLIRDVLTRSAAVIVNDAQNDAVRCADAYVRASGVKSMMAVPIRRKTETFGALYLESRLATGAFTEDRVRLLELLSTQMSISIENAMLFQRHEAEVSERRHAEQRVRFLAEASMMLADGVGVDAVLERLPRAAVPFLADWATVDVLIEDGSLRRAAAYHEDPRMQSLLQELTERYSPPMSSSAPGVIALRTAKPVLLSDMPESEVRELRADARHAELARLLGSRSLIAVPLFARGRRLGALTLHVGPRRARFGRADVALAQELARRAASLLDKAHLEAELSQSQKLEAIGRLSAGVAHDFNSFLQVVLANAELLSMSASLEPGAAENVAQIQAAAQGAAEVTRGLLAVGRKQVLEPQVLHVGGFLESSRGMLRGLAGDRIEVVFDSDAKVGEIEVDRSQLTQVVTNLVTNARDAMPAGGTILIRAAEMCLDEDGRAAQRGEGRDYVCVSVSDTGVGMDATTRMHLFEPFYTTKKKGKGTGIGLATVRGVVEQSGGKILVDSRLGAGSRFTVCFPKLARTRQ